MKKLVLLFALLMPVMAFADPGERHHEHEHHEWHGGHFGWGEFVGGIILGGIIAHEIDGHYYDQDNREVRRVTVCNDIPLYNVYGQIVQYQRQCHDEWVRVNY